MKFTPKIEKALKTAALLHRDQLRKSKEAIPYITHPYAVAMVLSGHTDNEDVIVAGLLHDTIEDSEYTPEQLENDFGETVREIVEGVTELKTDDDGNKLPWNTRKDLYVKNIANDTQESLLLCAADKICNMRNQIDDFAKYGEEIFKNFNSTPEERYMYHYNVFQVLKKRLRKKKILEEYGELLRESGSFQILRPVKKPIQCVLWETEGKALTEMLMSGIFVSVKTYEDWSDLTRKLFRCKECGQLYFYEHYEPWMVSEDEYSTYLPVETEEFADNLKDIMPIELLKYHPEIRWNNGKEAYWTGKKS